MKTLETLYFPDTAVLSPRQLPLFLLFPTVHIIAPVEDDPQNQDLLMNNRFCKIHTPHPLADDRQRFLYLINDIQNRKDDYAAQLSHITLASMSQHQDTDELSKHQIVSSLLGKPLVEKSDGDNNRNAVLWQARLVLKIGEILDREEEELARSLAFLEESETDLFDRLKGEGDDDQDIPELYEDLNSIKAKLDKPRTDSIDKRLRAWFRYVEGAELPRCPLWSTTSQEAADILFEHHEQEHDSSPQQIATLKLPAVLDPSENNLLTEIDHFHRIAQEQLPPIMSMIFGATGNIADESAFLDAVEKWQQQLDIAYPQEKYGRVTVSFHLFSAPLPRYSGLKTMETELEGAPNILAIFNI